MKTNFSILFYTRGRDALGTTPIYLRITVDGKRSEISTGRRCRQDRWNASSGRLTGSKEDVKSINAYLDHLQSRVYDAHHSLTKDDENITAEAIKNKLLGKTSDRHMLIDIFKDHNQKIATLVGNGFAKGTLQRYEISLRHTEKFLEFKYKVKDIDIKKIDNAFILEYEFYLRSVRKCENNSAVKYLKNFGKIIRICLANGWITVNPFVNYKGKLKPVDRTFLTADEIIIIENKQFETDRLLHVRDVFLFCCFTGLAYTDVQRLKRDQISKGIDGDQWVFTKRQKTGSRSSVPLLPTAIKLIDKYKSHPVCENKGTVLPVPSNQKMNEYLKEIAEVCGIRKTLTSHIARHTFATTITLNNGVPIESVSKMLGHSSLKQTLHYAKILESKVSADMRALKEKMQATLSS